MITCLQLGRLGRMGNALFQIAGCIGIARKSGQPFAFPKLILHDMVERFGSTEDIELYKYLVNPLPEIPEGLAFRDYGYFWEYRDIYLPNNNWSIDAHLQSVKWFEHCIDEVRHCFTFKDEYPQNDYVAIHYRAGDYIDDPNAYHPRCGMDYYFKAIKEFPEGSTFRVFSDNAYEANKMFGGQYEVTGGDYISSFKMMKASKSFITANSSYSHMAALLGSHPEKKIVMPKRWFGTQANGLSFDSLYPPNAIVI